MTMRTTPKTTAGTIVATLPARTITRCTARTVVIRVALAVLLAAIVLGAAPSGAEARTTDNTGPVTRIAIPRLHASMPVVTAPLVGRTVRVPGGVGKVGWMDFSRRPGDMTGNSAFATHRDTGSGGRGQHSPFYKAPRLRKNSIIKVTQGRYVFTYRVDRVITTKGHVLPAVALNRTSRQPTLTLSLCGGRINPRTHHWTAEVTVVAHMAHQTV